MRSQTYKFNTGHRNISIKRDIGREFLQASHCFTCEKILERKKYDNGRLEDWQRFLGRKTCDAECLKKYLIGETNPNYRGGTKKCAICGIQKTHYDKRAINEFCAKCWADLQRGNPRKDTLSTIQRVIANTTKISNKLEV